MKKLDLTHSYIKRRRNICRPSIVIVLFWAFCLFISNVSFATTISWNASSGVLPDDSSLPSESRFIILNNSSFVSLQNGFLNTNDTGVSQEVDIIKEDIDTILSDENWIYQVELRMNSHNRPLLDWGAEMGVATEDRWGMIIISRNAVGFEGAGGNSFINGLSYTMDTTDDFHIYRVEKVFDTVNLFIDSFENPVLSVNYGALYPSNFHHIRLAASSGPGISNFDVRSFLFCSNVAPIIDSVLEFFDGSVADGSLEGSGPGNSANGRLNALRDMLEMEGDLINICDIEGACEQLMAAYKKCDGNDPEFVEGEAVSELSNMILDLMDELGCQ